VVAFGIDQERNAHTELMGTLNTGSKTGGGQLPVVMSFESTGGSWGVNEGDTAPPIKIGTGLGIASPPAVIAFDTYNQTVGEVSHTLRDPNGTFGDALPAVVCTTVTHEGADASEDGTGRGTPIVARMVAFGEYSTDGTASTIKQRDYKDATDHEVCGTIDFGGHGGSYNGQDAYQGRIRAEAGRPRRLTPKECERLMSWPDDHTRYGTKDDGTVYELSDTARYRLCGNGVGSVCVQWIAGRLAAAITGAMGVAA
jgi:DNA (cytosine-5)-methyltransferase 1